IVGLGAAQAGYASGGRITVSVRIPHDLDQLVHDCLRRRQIGAAHSEVNEHGTASAGARIEPIDLLKQLVWKPANLVKLFHVRSQRRGRLRGVPYAYLQSRSIAGSHFAPMALSVSWP